MNFIQHPSYSEQIHDTDLILSKLSMENLEKLLERFEMKWISFERLKTSGQISLIFNIKAQSNSSSFVELILKICNPHPYWKECRTKNEVYTMKYLIEHTTIPIPKILDYSDNPQTSILACEYILMEKIEGNTLESVIDDMSNETLLITAMELIDYVKQLRRLKLPQMNQIGSFSSQEMLLGGSIEDGPTLGPFDTPREYIIEHLQWTRKRIQTDQQLLEHGEHLIDALERIIHHAQIDRHLFNFPMKYHFTHTDLNASNILVDENTGKILSILDWERCAMTFINNDIEFHSSWFDHPQQENQFQSLLQQQQNYLDLVHDANNIQLIEKYFNIVYSAMYATFYSSTWFDCEETMTEHIQRFIKDTENALSTFYSWRND